MDNPEYYCAHCGASNTSEAELCFACGRSLKITAALPLEDVQNARILQERYRLLDMIGEGGFSTVYKAEDLQTKRMMAIKAVTLRGLRAQEKIEATDAFNRELHMLNKLSHRNLPHIYDNFADAECWYLVMDFIAGQTLEKRLEQLGITRFPLEEVLDIALLLCDVLNYLHLKEPAIIFRDLKPANIMLTSDGHLFLIDFGIARHFKPGKARDTIPFGSPGYAAPEQYGKAQTTPRADIYSLGAILHQLLSGQDPSHTPFSFTSLHRPEVAELEPLLLSMVAMDASKRPGSIKEVQGVLQQFAAQKTHQRGLHGHVQTPFYPDPYAALPWPPPSPSYANGPFPTMTGQQSQQQQAFAPPQSALPKRRNYYAIASLTLSIIGIVFPIYIWLQCAIILVTNRSNAFPLLYFLVPFMVIPSLLSIIFGHIAKRRARTIRAMQSSSNTATFGMVIGYLFGTLYLVCAICTFTIFLTFALH